MAKIELIKQFRGRAKYEKLGGSRPHIFSYDLGKYYRANKVTEFMKEKADKIPKSESLFFATNARYYNLNNKTMFSDYSSKDKINVAPSYLEDSQVNIEDSMIRFISLYVLDKNPNIYGKKKDGKKKVGDDEHNDCLFNAIAKCFNYQFNLLPREIRRAPRLKSFLGLERDDKIELSEELFQQLENIMNCSFIVSGEYEYVSNIIKKVNISLFVKKEHITATYNEGKESKLFARQKENILFFKFDNDNVIIFIEGCEKEITHEKHKEYAQNSKYLLIKCKCDDDFNDVSTKYFQRADKLLISSNKVINYYKSQYSSVLGYDIWKQMTKFMNTPEELDDFEQIVINFALHGGIHYSKPGNYEDAYDIDMNSAYMHYLASPNFNFPVTKPNYKEFSNEEFQNLKFYPYGFYLVIFKNMHDYFTNFKVNVVQWVTHIDLKCALLLGVIFSIVESKTNALLYESKNCIKGNHAFKKYCNFLYDLKKKGEDVKDLTVSIWGVFAQKNVKRYRLKDDETVNLDNQFIESIDETEKVSIIKTTPKVGQIFKYPMCRLGPFLTAYVRLKMIEILMEQPFNTVYQINTDGWISCLQRKDLEIGKEMGQFKTFKGSCQVMNSMCVKFKCTTCHKYGKKKCC